MSKIKFGTGKASVTLDTELEAAVRTVINRTIPTVSRRMEAEVEEVHSGALARWPVRTGRSRAALEHGLRIVRDEGEAVLEGYVGTGSEYGYFIKSYQHGLGGKSPWVELARKPMEDRASDLAEDLERDLTKLARTGRG